MKPEELLNLDMTAADIPMARQYALTANLMSQSHEELAEARTRLAEAGDEMAKLMGRITSVEEITMVAHSAVNDAVLLSQLVTLSSSHEKRVGFMASWGLSKVADENAGLLVPFSSGTYRGTPECRK
ncbi:MAG: hypothetical protein MZV63_32670 [Marinilabiliales bacterium]|nr:hypothetical protein [Marinilabiliales bacterium]